MFKLILAIAAILAYLTISIVLSIVVADTNSISITSESPVTPVYDSYGGMVNWESYYGRMVITESRNIPKAIGVGFGAFVGFMVAGILAVLIVRAICTSMKNEEAEQIAKDAIRELHNPSLRVEKINDRVSIATKGGRRYLIENGVATLLDD